jgi:hypothetical protein
LAKLTAFSFTIDVQLKGENRVDGQTPEKKGPPTSKVQPNPLGSSVSASMRARSRLRARMFLTALTSLSRMSPHVGHTWALSDGCSVRNKPLLGPSITPNPFTLGDGGPTE